MNKLNEREKEYLVAMRPFLKPDVNEQHVLNLIRIIESRGVQHGRSGYTQDVTWRDDQLL